MRSYRYAPGSALTFDERRALFLVACGHSQPEAARHMSVCADTFKARLRGARARLAARNTPHAIALAITQGVILGRRIAMEESGIEVAEREDTDGYAWSWQEADHGTAIQREVKWVPNSASAVSRMRVPPGGWNQQAIAIPHDVTTAKDVRERVIRPMVKAAAERGT